MIGCRLINLPSNDTDTNVMFQDQMDNFGRMTDLASQAGVLVWVTTTQPRNFSAQAQRMLQMQVRDAINTKYGEHALDFWNPFADANGKINAMYDIDAKVPEAVVTKR